MDEKPDNSISRPNLDQITDEALVELYRTTHDQAAVEILITRYQARLWAMAFRRSHFQDKPFIDDIIQMVFYTIFHIIKDRGFASRGPGSFKAWAFDITNKVMLSENQRRRKRDRPVTDAYLGSFSDEMRGRQMDSASLTDDDEKYLSRLPEAIARLKPLDQKLLRLRQANMSYEQIMLVPEFAKYKKSGRLRMRYCRILESLREYLRKE